MFPVIIISNMKMFELPALTATAMIPYFYGQICFLILINFVNDLKMRYFLDSIYGDKSTSSCNEDHLWCYL